MPRNDDDEDDRARPWKKKGRDDERDERDDEADRPRRRRRDNEEDDDDFGDYDSGARRRGGRMSREDLREIAGRQRGIILCILAYFGLVAASFAVPDEMRLYVALVVLPVGITGAVFVFLLAVKVYGSNTGVVYGILTLIPLVGLVVLLIINQKATGILTKNGIRVGLLGANSSDL